MIVPAQILMSCSVWHRHGAFQSCIIRLRPAHSDREYTLLPPCKELHVILNLCHMLTALLTPEQCHAASEGMLGNMCRIDMMADCEKEAEASIRLRLNPNVSACFVLESLPGAA